MKIVTARNHIRKHNRKYLAGTALLAGAGTVAALLGLQLYGQHVAKKEKARQKKS